MMKRITFRPSRRNRYGFTLTEVLLVLAILGVIAAMVIPNIVGQQKNAYIRQSRINISALEANAKTYNVDHDGEWPKSINDMMNPGQDSTGKQLPPYVEKIPKDAWSQPLHYEYPSGKMGGIDKPAIWSYGPNKQNEDGRGDDINSWSEIVHFDRGGT